MMTNGINPVDADFLKTILVYALIFKMDKNLVLIVVHYKELCIKFFRGGDTFTMKKPFDTMRNL